MSPSKPPKLGDQTLDPPTHQTVTDPHSAHKTTPSGLVIPDEKPLDADPNLVTSDLTADEAAEVHSILGVGADGDVKDGEAPALPLETSILLESGQRQPLGYQKGDGKDFRVLAADKCYYEHVSEHPSTGEWVYRQTK